MTTTTEVIVSPEEHAEIQTCINCPLPHCIPDSHDCPLRNPLKSGERICPVCGGHFTPITKGHSRIYCSTPCFNKARSRRQRGLPVANPVDKVCPVCGKPIPPEALLRQKYCSYKCRWTRNNEQYYWLPRRTAQVST